MYTFFFHYNKPASQRAGKPQISVHYKNKCHIVDNIICKTPIAGKLNKRQPRFVVKGKCKNFRIRNNVCYIS